MKSPLQVTGIDHVVFHVKDLARSKKFYIDFLGMDIDHESSWQCFLKCGNQGVALFEVEDGDEFTAEAKSIIWPCASSPGNSSASKHIGKRRHRSHTAAKEIPLASTSPIRTAIVCNC